MDVEITRDGLKLQGKVERAAGDKTAALIIFHGFGVYSVPSEPLARSN